MIDNVLEKELCLLHFFSPPVYCFYWSPWCTINIMGFRVTHQILQLSIPFIFFLLVYSKFKLYNYCWRLLRETDPMNSRVNWKCWLIFSEGRNTRGNRGTDVQHDSWNKIAKGSEYNRHRNYINVKQTFNTHPTHTPISHFTHWYWVMCGCMGLGVWVFLYNDPRNYSL